MNTENDIKEFGFRHISINTVYNGSAGNGLPLSCVVINFFQTQNLSKSLNMPIVCVLISI